MKKLNKKGFTLIELLAVIVILAILIAVAVPAITRYLAEARKGTFVDNAQAAITAVRDEMIISSIGTTSVSYDAGTKYIEKDTKATVYTKDAINKLLEKKLNTSPYGNVYSADSYIKVTQASDGTYTFYVCLSDGTYKVEGNENELGKDKFGSGTCTKPMPQS